MQYAQNQYPAAQGQDPYAVQHYQPTYGAIEVSASFSFLQWMLFFTKPVITINGHKQQFPWNQQHLIMLPPGQHHVRIHYGWIMFDGNPIEGVIPVYESHITQLTYETRFLTFSPGLLRQHGYRPWAAPALPAPQQPVAALPAAY